MILCADDKNGMLFNHRRVSRDKKVIESIIELVQNRRLWISEFSKSLFDGNASIDSDMLDKATDDEFCFVENLRLYPHYNKISEIYLYRWNRIYPSDFQIDIDIEKGFCLTDSLEFVGNSHEKITLEVWKRR